MDKEKKKLYDKKYRLKNPNKNKDYYQANKSELLTKQKIKRSLRTEEEIKADKIEAKLKRIKRKEKAKAYMKIYRKKHRKEIAQKTKEYRTKNKEKTSITRRKYKNSKRKDPVFKLRHNISIIVNSALKSNNSSKKGKSIIKYLPYSINELKLHLESQFESWMNWENWGRYIVKSWDDKDPKTWKWQIDHIVPQSLLPYSSMEEVNFKKCWALTNLRPYSAKQNIQEGCRR